MDDPRIRPVGPGDVDAVAGLIRELAEYERLPQECHVVPAQLTAALFGTNPALFGSVAEVDGTVVGFSLWFLNFSTWEGVHGIYLEDLYVQPAHRGSGLGRALLVQLAQTAADRGYARVEWSVLDWNTPAIDFYRAAGAAGMTDWTTFRLTGPALFRLAELG